MDDLAVVTLTQSTLSCLLSLQCTKPPFALLICPRPTTPISLQLKKQKKKEGYLGKTEKEREFWALDDKACVWLGKLKWKTRVVVLVGKTTHAWEWAEAWWLPQWSREGRQKTPNLSIRLRSISRKMARKMNRKMNRKNKSTHGCLGIQNVLWRKGKRGRHARKAMARSTDTKFANTLAFVLALHIQIVCKACLAQYSLPALQPPNAGSFGLIPSHCARQAQVCSLRRCSITEWGASRPWCRHPIRCAAYADAPVKTVKEKVEAECGE